MGHEAWSDDAPPPEQDPYRPGEAPLGQPIHPGPGPQAAYYGPDPAAIVKAPAICLIVFGAVFGLMSLCNTGYGLALIAGVIPQQQQMPPDAPPEMVEFMETYMRVVPFTTVAFGFIGLVTCVLAGVSGAKLMNLTGGGMAKVSAILIMSPLWGCCCLGIPLGIWVLVTLAKPEVSEALH
ncbi:MAG: hypothetical protein R3F62_06630 [Planctomycetota bacterium]